MWRRLLGRRLLFFGRLLEVVHVRANACTDVSAVSPRSSLCPPPPSTQPASTDTRLCRPSRGLVSWAAAQTAVAPETQTAARCTVKELSSQAREAGAPYCWRTRQTLSRAHRHTTSWWAGKPVWCTGAVILATPRGSRGGGPPPGPPPWPYGGAFMLAATLSATWHARGRFLLLSGRVPGSLQAWPTAAIAGFVPLLSPPFAKRHLRARSSTLGSVQSKGATWQRAQTSCRMHSFRS